MTVTAFAAFLGGVLTLFAPCAAMLLPSFFAYAFVSRTTLLARTLAFTLGVLVMLVPLGVFAASLGNLIRSHAAALTTIAGVVVIVLGLAQAFSLSFPTPQLAHRLMSQATSPAPISEDGHAAGKPGFPLGSRARRSEPTAVAVFTLGAGYALAGVGCSGPILGAALSAAALTGSAWEGAILMTAFALGMALPVALLAFLWDALAVNERAWLRPRPLKVWGRWTTWQNFIAGIIFVVLGLILVLFGGHIGLPSLLSVQKQINVETHIIELTSAVPTLLFVAFALIVSVLVVVFWRERTKAAGQHNDDEQ